MVMGSPPRTTRRLGSCLSEANEKRCPRGVIKTCAMQRRPRPHGAGATPKSKRNSRDKRVPLRLSVSKCQKQRWRQQTLGFFKCTVSKEEMELASGMKSQAENVSPEEDPPEVDSVKEVNSREELHPREEVDDVARSDLPEVNSLVEVDTVKSADKEVAVMELEHAQEAVLMVPETQLSPAKSDAAHGPVYASVCLREEEDVEGVVDKPYLVLQVTPATETGTNRPELRLLLRNRAQDREEVCYLRNEWAGATVVPGDLVRVNGCYDCTEGCYIVDSEGSMIVYPDTLVSGTAVANSIVCTRKSVLAEKFKGSSSDSEVMVLGQMLHAVFQATVVKVQRMEVRARQPRVLERVIRQEARKCCTSLKMLESLYALNLSEKEAEEKLLEFLPSIQDFCLKYLHSEPQGDKGFIEMKRLEDSEVGSSVCVSEVTDIEENIWSPRYGLKGRVDVTVEMRERRGVARETVTCHRVPVELKTGKVHCKQGTVEHRAQVILYSMMLRDRYRMSAHAGGLLAYLKACHVQGIPTLPHEKTGLLMARNDLARYLSKTSTGLPHTIKDQHICKFCPQLKLCSLYHKSLEEGFPESDQGLDGLLSAQVSHLSPAHLEFFAHWYKLITEEGDHVKKKEPPPAWLHTAHLREREGLGFSDMQACLPILSKSTGRCSQSFTKVPGSSPSCGHTLPLMLDTNERVFVSHQDGSGWALAVGSVLRVGEGPEVRLDLDKAVSCTGGVVYRIDRAPGYSGGAMAASLADFCISDSEREHRLRELIIDGHAPRFRPASGVCASYSYKLNSSQKAAVEKVLTAQDYALILGMPGTGKTTTIACLIESLVALGKTVLLSSYTHSAVDNILLKLNVDEVPFLRLGSLSRVHHTLHTATPTHLCRHARSIQELEGVFSSRPVVATTCLGVSHPLFTRRSFDVCIIDEASMLTLPVSLGPIRHARTFVLVGDHHQLSPLVMSQQAREGGLDVSLFQFLRDHHPSSVAFLDKQYRMNREIMDLANHLVYNGRLQCGTETVALGRLSLPYLPQPSELETWLWHSLDPSHPVLFLNTDGYKEAREVLAGDQVTNPHEARLIALLVRELTECGLQATEVGVITPLRNQQFLIQQHIQEVFTTADHSRSLFCSPSQSSSLVSATSSHPRHSEHVPHSVAQQPQSPPLSSTFLLCYPPSVPVEVSTVDKYQGRDKDCIIMSFVRSNQEGNTGKLLHNWRRINVAITRAKKKLLLVGSKSTLSSVPFLKNLLHYMSSNKAILNVSI